MFFRIGAAPSSIDFLAPPVLLFSVEIMSDMDMLLRFASNVTTSPRADFGNDRPCALGSAPDMRGSLDIT